MSDVIFHAVEKISYYQKCRWHDSRTLWQIALIRPALAWFRKWGDGNIWGNWTPKLLIRSGHYSLVMLWLWKTETDHLGTVTFFTQLSQEQRSWNPTIYIYRFISGVINMTATPWWFFFHKNCSKGKIIKSNPFVDKYKTLGKKGWIENTYRADSRFVPSQWETTLLCNNLSHWPGRKPRISPDL